MVRGPKDGEGVDWFIEKDEGIYGSKLGDTEIIKELMLPPGRRRLPTPPTYVRPDHYREIFNIHMTLEGLFRLR